MYQGRCLCGQIAFEVTEANTPIGMCHCSKCRRVTGAGSHAEFMTARDNLRWLSGESLVKQYAMPDGWRTAFCSECGSPMPKLHSGGGAWWVPAGLLDEPTDLRVSGHIWVGSKAAWDEIAGDAPRYAGEPVAPKPA